MPQPQKTILLINDKGFFAGAGIATKRQAQSFLSKGYDVALVCTDDVIKLHHKDFDFDFGGLQGRYLGAFPVAPVAICDDAFKLGVLQDKSYMELEGVLADISPDLVIFGNVHGGRWPISWLTKTRDLGFQVVAYMHDLHYLTGRCAYPMDCDKYLRGCDQTCPTPNEYPEQKPHLIQDAWDERTAAFGTSDPIPLITNSHWTAQKAQERYPSHPHIEVAHLGLDEMQFSPQLQHIARDALKLPADDFVVMIAANDFGFRPKGGEMLADTIYRILEAIDAHILLVGMRANRFPDLLTHPAITYFEALHSDNMPLAFSAADIYVTLSAAEAFGQTALEASSCTTPIIAQPNGGLVDIARNGQNAILVNTFSGQEFTDALQKLRHDPVLRRLMGRTGRQIVCNEFNLEAQAKAWETALQDIFHND